VFIKSLLVWMTIIPLAIVNGIARETLLTPLLGEAIALPLSGVLLCLLILAVSLIFIAKLGAAPVKTYQKIGLLWLVLTVTFEISMALSSGQSIAEILQQYHPGTGNLWLIVVLFTAAAPLIAAKIRGLIETKV
jgi:hypothetical protein